MDSFRGLAQGFLGRAGAAMMLETILVLMTVVTPGTAQARTSAQPCREMQSGLTEPTAMVMDHRGFLYVADRAERCVVCLSPDGTTATLLRGVIPVALAVDRRKNVYVATEDGSILRLGPDGSRHELARGLGEISGMCADRDGGLLVLFRDQGKVMKIKAEAVDERP